MRVTIDLLDEYSNVLTMTCVGVHTLNWKAFTHCADLSKGTVFKMIKTNGNPEVILVQSKN